MTDKKQNLIDYAIAQGDDALIFGQRLSEWCYHAPFLEEDLAIANVALDIIGRAQMFYDYAVELEGNKRTPDDIAFLRDTREFRNLLILELPIGDFGFTIARQFIVDSFNVIYLEKMTASTDERLAAIAAKSIKESRYHLRRSQDWVLRLGDGTEESHQHIQKGFNELWGYTGELFTMTPAEQALLADGIVVDREQLRDEWMRNMQATLQQATLTLPDDEWQSTGGRDGVHTEHHGHLLAEMQFLQRAYPGLEW